MDSRERAREIVSALSLEEKARLVSGRDMWHTQPVALADLPAIRMADGPHGVRRPHAGGDDSFGLMPSVPATCFPTAAALACSWDEDLAGEVGRAIGLEARAQGVSVVLGPGLNLKRHPCGGRNFEYLSEDPLLSGRMAAAVVRGIQSTGTAACLKHYAANNQETRRMVIDTVVDERTLRELYLRGFEVAVAESRPLAVMCAYNRVNGEYCSESRRLLTEVLRDEWGFDGLVMSDWGAVNDRVAGLEGGLDLEMPSSSGAHDEAVVRAIAEGRLNGSVLDTAARHVVELVLAVSDPPGDGNTAFDAASHHVLARRAAAESMVLLANDGVLPLAPTERIAVAGAFAESARYQGGGSSRVEPTRLDSALEALRHRVGTRGVVTYSPGYDPVTGSSTDELIARAVENAAKADVCVLFIGLPDAWESEGFDRPHMQLPEAHDRLVESVCEANPRTIVVLSNGAPIEMSWAERPAAILEGYLGGQAGGSAVADVLLGITEPGGRLAETFPLSRADVPADANFPGEPRQVCYREGLNVGYRHFQSAGVPVRFPFGHGLSYTTFDYGPLELSAGHITEHGQVEARMTVTNTGMRAGSTVVQLYVRDVESTVYRPALELRGFSKVRLAPGESVEVVFTLDRRGFAFYDVTSRAWQVERGEFELLAGASAADIRSRARVFVDSAFTPPLATNHGGPVADDDEFAAALAHPVPAAEPLRPFTRTSTVDDLGVTVSGRLVRSRMVATVRRRVAGIDDPRVAALVERALLDMPLRNLVTMSGGMMSWRALDALIDVLNGRYLSALTGLLRRRRVPRQGRP